MTVTRSSFHYNPNQLLLAVDLLGTLVFAIEGALTAIKGDLDFFGLMVLSFITAAGGESFAISSSATFLRIQSVTGGMA